MFPWMGNVVRCRKFSVGYVSQQLLFSVIGKNGKDECVIVYLWTAESLVGVQDLRHQYYLNQGAF